MKSKLQVNALLRIVPYLCLAFLWGCSNIMNNHPHNAVPLEAGKRQILFGFTTSSKVYQLHDYAPAAADSAVKRQEKLRLNGHMPLGGAIGLGKGFAISGQLANFVGPGFRVKTTYGYMSDVPSLNNYEAVGFYSKASLHKSLPLGHDVFLAAFPAYGIGKGVERLGQYARLRFNYKSVELPLTLSKQIKFSNGMQVVLSGTGRTACDWINSDLLIITPLDMHFEPTFYYNQPDIQAFRNAIMGHLDFRSKKHFFSIQLGNEHVKLKSAESWEPIVYVGWGIYFE